MAPRKKLDLTGHLDDVIHMFNVEKMTCRQIAAKLKDEHGIDISHVVVAKTVKQHNERLDQMEEKAIIEREKIKALAELAGDDDINYLDIAKLLNNRLMIHLTNALDQMDNKENYFHDISKLVTAIESVSRNLTAIHKSETNKEAMLEEVRERFREALYDLLLDEKPELVYELTTYLKKVQQEELDEQKRKKKNEK